MQDTTKKFELRDEYEKRKIVFWYDRDKTADPEGLESIKSALAEHGIKMHILNNNFFETKKLLENLHFFITDTIFNSLPPTRTPGSPRSPAR